MTHQELDWNDMMREAIHRSQQETLRLHQSKLVSGTIYDNSNIEEIVEESYKKLLK